MKQLVVFIIGASILALCNAGCFVRAPEIGKMGEEPTGCTSKGEIHKIGTNWKTKDCWNCHCRLDGSMRCCTGFGIPFGYDKENCKRVFDKESCSYKLIPIKDPSVVCKERGMVG